ncbi:PAS domain-containing protein [Myxococcus stipitatus]|uniref:PAS domain-containing protein n=1 Tax=Myxococcus stipitatus TaxID=83455 RepID=UPI001F47E16A|nr:PAS domain-containing protein [Myxococcus stipitatus]MCE9672859.1 PAS domain-containing protein [Myxococcus stipitatus]
MHGRGASTTQADAIEGFTSEQAEFFLETLLGSAPIGLAFVDRSLRFIHVNEALARMNGIPRVAHLGRKVSEIVPELWPVVEPCYRQVLEQGRAVRDLELSGTTKKSPGQTRHFLTNYFPILNGAGEVQGVGLSVMETTEQKRAQQALRVNEQRYRSLVEASAQPVWTTDPRGQLLEPAPRWMAFTGQSHGAHLGLGWLDAIHPTDRARFVTEWRSTLATRTPYRGEIRLRHRDGAWRDVIVRGVPVMDDDGIVREWIATAEDVSVHRAAERELRQTTQALAASQERYRTFVAQSTEGIWRMEVDPPLDTRLPVAEQVEALIARGRIAETNEAMARMTGFESARDMVGATLRQLLDRTHGVREESVLGFVRDGYRGVDVESRQPDRDGIMRVRLANFIGVVENGRLLRIWGTQRDITEQAQAKEALEISRAQARQREQQLRVITDALPALVAYVDREERILFCNRAFETWFGVRPRDLVGRTVREAGGEAFHSLSRDWLRRALDGEHVTHETSFLLADGRRLHVQATYVPYQDGDGQVQGCVVLVNDITDRKRTEAEVEAQRARLYDVLMNAPAPIAILTGSEQTFSLVNPVYQQMSSGLDLRGMSLRALSEQSARARDYSEELARVYETGRRETLLEQPLIVDLDGAVEQHYFNIVYQPLRDARGEVDSVLSFALDVTEQVRARQKAEELAAHLRSQQSWLEAVLGLTPIPLVLVEPGSGRALFANQAAHQLAGGHFALDVPVQRYDTAYHVVDDDGRSVPNEQTPAARAAQGEALRRAPGTWMTPMGRREVLIDSEQLPAMHGHPSTIVLAIQDVTQLKEIELQLQEAVRLRDEFLTVASHELKTPLTPLQIKLQGLARAAMGSTSEGQLRQRVMRTAQNTSLQVRKLTALINDLLDVTQLTGAPLPLELGDVDLSEVVREVVRQFRTPAAQVDSELIVQAPGPVVGRWDRRRLEQVVRGLVSNAIKYGPGEPVLLRVERHSGVGRLTVRDRGIGIASQDLSRIFEKFGRAVSSRNYGGLGLGLFISRRIVEAHQGTIRAESRRGHGASFIVELPLAGPELRPPTAMH